MALRHVFALVGETLQEAADAMSAGDIRTSVGKALSSAHKGTGIYPDYVDHTGDEKSGTVRYNVGGYSEPDYRQAPYSQGTENSDTAHAVDLTKEKKVAPVMTWCEQPDDCDGYAAMEAAKLYTPGAIPLCERFVSKTERAGADSGDFAGKGKSFPVLKKEDVKAALSSLGRAGSDNYSKDVIHGKIVAIAKRKGWGGELAAADQDDAGSKESKTGEADGVRLCESASFPSTFEFREASAVNPLVKIISPGRGSSGYYTKEVLQRDAPKIFKRGTLMYINHATQAEEAQRPEGDWSKLAAVTTGDAYWDEAGKDGPAVYAPAKVFSGHAAEVAEKAPHTGVSIRAQGRRDDKAIAPDGKPGLVTALTHAESIDLVTKAGRDGKLLLESADSEFHEGGDMDANALKKLQEANTKIFKGFATGKARELAATTLKPIRLPEASKVAIMERACVDVPITEAGDFDEAGFKKALEAEIQYAAAFLPDGAKVVGLGVAAPDPKVVEAEREKNEKVRKHAMNRSASNLGITTKEGQRIFREGRAAFDSNFCNMPDKTVQVEA